MKKLATYALVGLAVWWAVQDPTSAAHLVHAIGNGLNHAAASLSSITNGH